MRGGGENSFEKYICNYLEKRGKNFLDARNSMTKTPGQWTTVLKK